MTPSLEPLAEPAAAPTGAAALNAPASLKELFWTFNGIALQGFGGVLAIAQRELVDRHRWLSNDQFIELLAISQVLPGPNIVNLSLIFGDRAFGVRGAIVALGGMLLIPLFIVLSLAAIYAEFAQVPMVAGALRGMGAIAAGLVIATAMKLLATLRTNPMGAWLCAAFTALTFIAIGLLRWPLVWVVLGLGTVTIAVAWRKLGR